MNGVRGTARRCGAAAVLVLALAGCAGAVVTNDGIEEQVISRLGAETADCPTDIPREVGAATVCTATRGDERFDVRVSVTAVRGDTAELAVEQVGGPASDTSTATSTDDSVEEQVRSRLGTDTADCPADLPGVVGRSMVCTATRDDDTFDVEVTVTAVRGNTIDLLIERVGGETPSVGPGAAVTGAEVAESVQRQLTATGKQVDRVYCPDLAARVGEAQRCTLVSGTGTYGVTVTVTSVQGTDVRFDIRVDETPS